MKTKDRVLSRNRMWLLLFSAAVLFAGCFWTSVLLAQDENRAAGAMLVGAFLLIGLATLAVIYVYMAVCLQTIGKKTNAENPWLAWIPIANVILMLNIARKPLWWILLMFIPLVNIIIAVIVWMEIAKARSKPEWWGILMIVPVANLVAPGYLAFSD